MFEKSESDKDEIKIEISDAISEKDLVKFTINVTSKVAAFTGDFKVIRSYNDFVWLHTSLSENDLYQGLLIPPKVSFLKSFCKDFLSIDKSREVYSQIPF